MKVVNQMTMDEKIDLILSRLDSLENKVDNLENKFDSLENKVNSLEHQVRLNTMTIENQINQAIQVMGEGYQLNAERFDRLDIEAVKNRADMAFSISQLANEKIDRLISKLNQSA